MEKDITNEKHPLEEKMEKALKMAERAWENADMPHIFADTEDEPGKIAIAILAGKIFDRLF